MKLSCNPNSHLCRASCVLGTVPSMSHATHLDIHNNPIEITVLLQKGDGDKEKFYDLSQVEQKGSASLSP